MVFIGCTDKIIIGSVHQIPDAFYLSGYIVHILFRSDPGLLGLLLDLLTMFVRSGLEVNIITFLTAESCDRICKYDLVGISNVRLAGCVGNRCCHIKFSFAAHVYFLLS